MVDSSSCLDHRATSRATTSPDNLTFTMHASGNNLMHQCRPCTGVLVYTDSQQAP